MKEITFTIVGALVIHGLRGGDKISLQTTLPAPFPRIDIHGLNLDFNVERGRGKDYLIHALGMKEGEIEIIDAHTKPMKFSNKG